MLNESLNTLRVEMNIKQALRCPEFKSQNSIWIVQQPILTEKTSNDIIAGSDR